MDNEKVLLYGYPVHLFVRNKYMSVSDYEGALNLKDIDKNVVTHLDKYKPYYCPLKHKKYDINCPSCKALYGIHK